MPRRTLALILASLLAIAVVVIGLAATQWDAVRSAYPRHNPFADLDVQAEPTFATRFKLLRVRTNAAYCRRALETSALRVQAVPDNPLEDGCGFENAVRIQRGTAALSSSFLATCPLAVSFAMFEQHVALAAARDVLGSELRSIDHVGSYVCRNIAGRDRRSDHATARAVDLTAFVLADGRRIRIAGNWKTATAEANFLRRLRDGACRYFATVLGPDYNRQHADHFHLGVGGFMACR